MLSLISLALVGFAFVTYLLLVRRGIYRRTPFEQYLLVGGATLLAFYAAWKDTSVLSWAVFAVSALALGAIVWYIHFESKFPRVGLEIKTGESFPSFSLPDSQGGIYESDEQRGKKSALYIFYRGDW